MGDYFFQINFLVYSVVVKLVPCLLLTVLMPAIIRGMWIAKRRRQRLVTRNPSASANATVLTTLGNTTNNNTNGSSSNNTQGTMLARLERRLSRSSSLSKNRANRKSTSLVNGTTDVQIVKPHHKKDEVS